MEEAVVIIGAGQGGATVAATLRQLGFGQPIVLVGAEAELPYERPSLSKDILSGVRSLEDVLVQPAHFYDEHSVEVLLGTTVVGIDAKNRVVLLDNGDKLRYSACVLATGGRVRQLQGLAPSPRVHYMRTTADTQRLRAAFAESKSVVVLGAGFLGMELASTASSLGLEVTVLEAAPRVLQRSLPPLMSQWLERRAAASNIRLLMNTHKPQIDVLDDRIQITLASREQIIADLLVVAVGQEPETTIGKAAGAAISATNGGILVNAQCATSIEGLYAVGDCTSQVGANGAHVRLESWQNAVEQAKVAAAAIAGSPQFACWTPWFWTDQLGCNVQLLGNPSEEVTWFVRGDPDADSPRFVIFGADSYGNLKQVIAVNSGGELRTLRPLLEQSIACDVRALCDTNTSLRQLVKNLQSEASTPTP